jgi:Xaa-Pro aminopeptidase
VIQRGLDAADAEVDTENDRADLGRDTHDSGSTHDAQDTLIGLDASPEAVGLVDSQATLPDSATRIKEASEITAKAMLEAMTSVRAGMYERDVKAIIDAVFSREGAEGLAFPDIVAAGKNAINLHYAGDNSQLKSGDLLEMDIGAEHDGYASDITRTIPISGTFSPRQRQLYDLVLSCQEEVARKLQTGVHSLAKANDIAVACFNNSPLRARAGGKDHTMDYFFTHVVSHFIGKEVHGGDTGWNYYSPIQVGQVITIEPGLYIADEGIGMRIEDDYVVGNVGVEKLIPDLISKADDIEQLMKIARQLSPLNSLRFDPQPPLAVNPADTDVAHHMGFLEAQR